MSVKITQDAIDAWYAKASKTEKSKYETFKTTHDSQLVTLNKKYNDANNEVNGWATSNANIKAGSKPASKTTRVQVFPAVETFPPVYPPNKPYTNFEFFNEPLPTGSGTLYTLNNFYAQKYYTGASGYGWPQTSNSIVELSQLSTTGRYVLVYLAWANSFYTNPAIVKYFNHLIYLAGTQSGEPAGTEATLQEYITKYQARAKEVTKLFAQQKTALDKAKTDIAAENADYESKLRNLIYKTGVGTSTTAAAAAPVKPPPNTTSPEATPSYTLGKDCEFNLPPHKWSLPTPPINVLNGESVNKSDQSEDDRRGRFWTWRASDQKFTSEGADKVDAVGKTRRPTKYGFQFLWNPETWSSSVQINPDVTPNSPQYWATSLPVFPSGQNMSFNIVVDRVNDFACFGPQTIKPTQQWSPTSFLDSANAARIALETQREQTMINFAEFYKGSNIINPQAKIDDLMKRGTLADIEYIYKVCNGDGWTRLDQNTSDIGFLMMTLVEIELGPNRYLGYLNSLGIEHTFFTENMVPLRTNVSLQFVLMASARVAAKKA
jgi:hypothetical protein